MTSPEIAFIARIDVLKEFETDVKIAIEKMATESRKEPGVKLYDIYSQKSDPCTIITHEKFKDQQALDSHKSSDHAKNFFEFLKGKMKTEKIEVTFLNAISSPNDLSENNQ